MSSEHYAQLSKHFSTLPNQLRPYCRSRLDCGRAVFGLASGRHLAAPLCSPATNVRKAAVRGCDRDRRLDSLRAG